jgi:hypothetical protein
MRRLLIAGATLASLLGIAIPSTQARPAESVCQSALVDYNKAMARLPELEAETASMGQYRAYSWRSTGENLRALEEHEAKRDSLLDETNKLMARLQRLLPVLKQCAQG